MIHYFSQTGNTKLLGDFLKDNINDSKTIYVGFWTDKGNANQETLDYLKTLHHQKIFLFGTAGFGKSEEYFKRIINEVVGSFMCQGKMPYSVLQRYLSLKESDKAPKNIDLLIENYYEALNHPNEEDLENLKKAIV